MTLTSEFGSVVRKPNRSFVVSPSLTLRTDFQRVHKPAKNVSRRARLRSQRTMKTELHTDSQRRANARIAVAPLERENRRRHAPSRHDDLATLRAVADDGRGVGAEVAPVRGTSALHIFTLSAGCKRSKLRDGRERRRRVRLRCRGDAPMGDLTLTVEGLLDILHVARDEIS